MGRLDEKIAIITGAGSGIGRACALRFAGEGAKIVAAGRRVETLQATLAAAEPLGASGIAVATDVRDDAQVEALVAAAEDTFGGLDVVVNNAGVGYSYQRERPKSMEPVADTPSEDWLDVMNINVNSVYRVSKYAIPALRRRGGGVIINVGSIFGLRGIPNAHAYATAKSGMLNLTRSMAMTYGPEGIRTNCLLPGFTDTEMIASWLAGQGDPFRDTALRFQICPLGRIGTPEDMANGCVYLASDEASYVNGAELVIDGGTSAKF